MKTVDLKFIELCDEIDYWKEESLKHKADAEYWRNKYSNLIHENLESSRKGIAGALMLALSVTDNPDGSLSINKRDRKILAEQFK